MGRIPAQEAVTQRTISLLKGLWRDGMVEQAGENPTARICIHGYKFQLHWDGDASCLPGLPVSEYFCIWLKQLSLGMVGMGEESKGTFLQDRGWKVSPSLSQLLHYSLLSRTGLTLEFFPVSPLSGPDVHCIGLWRCKLRWWTGIQQHSRENMHKHVLLEGGTVSREGAWNPSRKAYSHL